MNAQVTVVAAAVDKERLGYQACSLTHFSDNSAPAIAAGSKVEIGGALFEVTGDETINGLAGIANTSQIYFLLTVSGASFTASGTITAPTWSTSKQGWYTGGDRAIGGCFKDGAGNYTKKWLYEEKEIRSIRRYGDGSVGLDGDLSVAGAETVTGTLEGGGGVKAGAGNQVLLTKVINIGDWNMDATPNVTVALGVTASKIRSVRVMILADGGGTATDLLSRGIALAGVDGAWTLTGTDIGLSRTASGAYDNPSWDQTSFNRGYIFIEYVP